MRLILRSLRDELVELWARVGRRIYLLIGIEPPSLRGIAKREKRRKNARS